MTKDIQFLVFGEWLTVKEHIGKPFYECSDGSLHKDTDQAFMQETKLYLAKTKQSFPAWKIGGEVNRAVRHFGEW